MRWVVVTACIYDGLDVHGPFKDEADASQHAETHGGKVRRVVHAGLFTTSRAFVSVESCVFGGVTVYGWFPTRQAAEAFCHRQSLSSAPGVQFAAAAVS